MNDKHLHYNFPRLNNSLLVTAYKKALDLNLDEDFIALLKTELKKRNLLIDETEYRNLK